MINELPQQLSTDSERRGLRKRIEQTERECKKRLRQKSTPQQYQNLMMQVQALNAAITILDSIEGQ